MLLQPFLSNRTSSFSRVFAILVSSISIIGLLPSVVVAQQCGGTTDGNPTPLFLSPNFTVHTEIAPNSFVAYETGATTPECFPTAGVVVGANELGGMRDPQIVLFSSPIPPLGSPPPGQPPEIDIIEASMRRTTHGLTGTVLHAGGTLCTSISSEVVGITDETIAILRGNQLQEYPLPPNELPVGAAAIGFCPPGGSMILYAVETTLPSLEVVLGQDHDSISVDLTVAPSESFSNGLIAGVLHYSANSVTKYATGEGASEFPLGGTYASHVKVPSAVIVTTTVGTTVSIPLPLGSVVQEFESCALPFGTIATSTGGLSIDMNTTACGLIIEGKAASWPPAPIVCKKITGLAGCVRPQIDALAPKWAKVRARAFTTLAGVASDPPVGGFRRGKIWQPIFAPNPGYPGFPVPLRPAFAISTGGGDSAWATAWAAAGLVAVVPPCLQVVQGAAGGHTLIHTDGHVASWSAAVRDPFRFENYDDSEDLSINLDLSHEIFLPIDLNHHEFSETVYSFDMGTSLPNLPELCNAQITATHDTNSPQIEVIFQSNPLLGLDDTAITDNLENAFVYDPILAGYTVPNEIVVLSLTFDVPNGISSFEVTYNSSIAGSHFEQGYTGGPASSICGNGIVEAGEDCDAPNGVGCSSGCAVTGDLIELTLEAPPLPGFQELSLTLQSPVPVSEFSVAIEAPGSIFYEVVFDGTVTNSLNPELILTEFFDNEGMALHVLFDAIPPYDNSMLPPLSGPGQEIAVLLGNIHDPQQIAFSDAMRPQQSEIHYETFVVSYGEELHLPGPNLLTQVIVQGGGGPPFLRGDVNQDGSIDISDPISGLVYLFPGTFGGGALDCDDSFDANDDGQIDLADVYSLLNYMFMGQPMPQPFPLCGIDPTPDSLNCQLPPVPELCGTP